MPLCVCCCWSNSENQPSEVPGVHIGSVGTMGSVCIHSLQVRLTSATLQWMDKLASVVKEHKAAKIDFKSQEIGSHISIPHPTKLPWNTGFLIVENGWIMKKFPYLMEITISCSLDHLRLSWHIYVDIAYHSDVYRYFRFNGITCPRWGTSIVRMLREAPAELSIKQALPLVVIRSYTDSYKLYSYASNTLPLW